ncbi:Spc98 family-domain-containing protein [Choanephora cucurbitarum]|nr:Spc98 family-domain-containing protein [Choanephora cucurbitarum]
MSVFNSDDQLIRKLVQKIAGIQSDNPQWNRLLNKTKNALQYHKCTSTSDTEVNDAYKGLVEKFSIKGHSELAKAIEQYKTELLSPARPVVSNEETHQSTLKYDMLRLLISLSSSLNQNYTYAPRLSHILQNKTLTWEDVIKDDPLEGDHWRQWSDEMSSENSDASDHMDNYELEEDKGNDYSEPEPSMSLQHYRRYHPIALDTRSDQDGLSHLMTQQYWLDDSNLPEEELAGDALLRNPCQMSHVLGKLLYHQAQRNQLKAITEANMVREILFLLRGFGGVVFTQDDNGQFVLNRNYIVQHLSQAALHSILEEFCAFGNMLMRLKRIIQINTTCQTLQAFSFTVSNALSDFDGHLATWEANSGFITQDSSLTISLLQLRHQLNHLLECLKAIHDITIYIPFEETHRSIAAYLISALYEQALMTQISGQHCVYDALVSVLQKTLVPYGYIMDDWIFHGSLIADPSQEFYVTRNDNVSMNDSNFWLDGFHLNLESKAYAKRYPCPLFDEHIMTRIFFAGKAMNLLYKMGKPQVMSQEQPSFESTMKQFVPKKTFFTSSASFDLPDKSTRTFQPMLNAFMPLVGSSRNQDKQVHDLPQENSCNNLNQLFDQCLHACLEAYIEMPYAKAAQTLNQVLHLDCQLLNQLTSLSSIFLMLENDLMHTFCESLFFQIDHGAKWFDSRILNRTFTDACENSGYDEVVYLGIKQDDVSKEALTHAAYLEWIEFKVEIPWPLNNFVQKELLPSYSKILSFLLRLKRAKYVMEKKILFQARGQRIEKSDARAMRFYQLRMRVLWFINAFWRYMMTTILHAETINFYNKLSNSKDADEITALHYSFVTCIVDRCLLNEKAIAIKKSVTSIFDLAEQMKQLFRTYLHLDSANTQDNETFDNTLNAIEKEFQRTNEFISISLMILGKKGGFPWFESLATSLLAQN